MSLVNGRKIMRNGLSIFSAILVGALLIAIPVAESAEIPLDAGKQVAQKGGDDLLLDSGKVGGAKEVKRDTETIEDSTKKAHEALAAETQYPSAATCRTCHPKQYNEWAVSQHSYSQLSPAYLSLSNKILQLSNGTNGDFCLRCHSPVGANLGENPRMSNLKRHPTSREGITCMVCHRINKRYNKVSGRLDLEEGSLLKPVYGPLGNAEMERVLNNKDK